MQFGMPTLIENRSFEENTALCASLGLRFVELNMNFPEYRLEKLENTDFFLSAAERESIYLTVHLEENLNVADFNPLVADAYLQTVHRSIAVAKKLLPLRDRFGDNSQPMTVNMHMHHGIYVTLPDRKEWLYEREFESYREAFARFRSLCEEWIGGADVRICVENTDGFKSYEKAVIDDLLESPVFGLTWDIGHSKATSEADVPFLLERREKLIHFHIHDGTENPPKNHLALGDGEIDLQSRLAYAESRHARCVLETKTVPALTRSVRWLKEKGVLS
ncbi:MAG: TIM barrel protein [Clostridia bacterium]|nr:TIM barrel protein [Clostridia bacterium]